MIRDPNRQNFETLSLVASPVDESAITAQVLVYTIQNLHCLAEQGRDSLVQESDSE